jgi:hypothetical protein
MDDLVFRGPGSQVEVLRFVHIDPRQHLLMDFSQKHLVQRRRKSKFR